MQSKPTWHSEAQALRAQGLGVAEIARRLGRTYSGVYKAVNPERASVYGKRSSAQPRRKEAKRAWERANAARKRKTNPDPDPAIPGLLPIRNAQRHIIDFARVDVGDWERLRKYSFGFRTLRYVSTQINGQSVYLHHLVMPIPGMSRGGRQCDHINRDTTDNRRSNLRIVTPKQQMANRGGIFEKEAA